MEDKIKRFIVAGCCLAGCVCGASDDMFSWKPESLTTNEKAYFECAARTWIGKLWTNDYSRCKALIYARRYNFSPWATDVDVEFRLQGGASPFH